MNIFVGPIRVHVDTPSGSSRAHVGVLRTVFLYVLCPVLHLPWMPQDSFRVPQSLGPRQAQSIMLTSLHILSNGLKSQVLFDQLVTKVIEVHAINLV
jgi:hypothetical protein